MKLRNWLLLAACGLLAFGGCGESEPTRPQGAEKRSGDTRTSAGDTSSHGGGVAAGACVLAVTYRGNTYYGLDVSAVPRASGPVVMGILPPCNDTGREPGPGVTVELTAVEGVSPEIALLSPQTPDTVFLREGFDGPLPPELRPRR
jgi:hypothetical protein